MTENNNRKRVLLVGWDSADWNIINPLIEKGLMPHLDALVNRGVMGSIATLRPAASPMLWTTIATGKHAYKHGVLGFTQISGEGKVEPVSAYSRQCRALWNIFNLQGLRSNVVCWWPTHPAEPVNGVMVSDLFRRIPDSLKAAGPELFGRQVAEELRISWPLPENAVHPRMLYDAVSALRLHPRELPAGHIQPFVPGYAKATDKQKESCSFLSKMLAESVCVHNAATACMELEEWDLTAVYYYSPDGISHRFMEYYPPRLEWVDDADYRMFKNVIDATYIYHDKMLGRLLELAGEDTTVVLVSDHGFHSDHRRLRGLAKQALSIVEEHSQYGIFVMAGPGIKKDHRIYGATLLDVTPTILHAAGMPVGEDMDGNVLLDAFENPGEVRRIKTWEDVAGDAGVLKAEKPCGDDENELIMRELADLGYIEQPAAMTDSERVRGAKRFHDTNLALSYMSGGKLQEAAGMFEQVLSNNPDEYNAGVELVRCYIKLKLLDKVLPLIERLERIKEKVARENEAKVIEFAVSHGFNGSEKEVDAFVETLSAEERSRLKKQIVKCGRNPFAMDVLKGEYFTATGDFENAARAYLGAEEKGGDWYASVPLAFVQIKLERYDEALERLVKMRKKQPNNPQVCQGLSIAYFHTDKCDDGMQAALEAVSLRFFSPLSHYWLGMNLMRLKDYTGAQRAFEMASTQAPRFPAALEMLIELYSNVWIDDTKAAECRERLRQIQLER